MGKLTKQQIRTLEAAREHLVWAQEYIQSKDTVIARKTNMSCGENNDYINKAGEQIGAICKDIGSPLCGISHALGNINRLL